MWIAACVGDDMGEAASGASRIPARANRCVEHVSAPLELYRLRACRTQTGHAHSNPKGGNRPSIRYHAEIPPLLAQDSERGPMLTLIR
jgi:hypothetical protein